MPLPGSDEPRPGFIHFGRCPRRPSRHRVAGALEEHLEARAAQIALPGGEIDAGESPRGHVRRALAGTRELVRIAYRDPEHISERLTLHATQNLAQASREWAETARREQPDASTLKLAHDLREQSAQIARIDGAVAGTPFFIALVPGYISYLWQEARMGLRMAALYGRDPGTLRTAAEMLALRGVHPTVEEAEEAIRAVSGKPPPVTARRSLRTWVHSGYLVLVFGGFLAPSGDDERPSGTRARLRAAGGLALGGAIWALTWIVPVSFMIAMSWGCESHSRTLGLRTLALYDGEAATTKEAIAEARGRHDRGHARRQGVRAAALAVSVGIPIAFVAYANHVRQDTGINWVGAIGALVALSLVIAGAVYGSRR